ncbi:MAG: hypothetical protein WC607_02455 [Candidatus Micrarchaeia archaeon]
MKFFLLLLPALLLFGCLGGSPSPGGEPTPEPMENPAAALWSGWFRVTLSGGGPELSYNTVFESQDALFAEDGKFKILNERVSCSYHTETHIPPLYETLPPTDSVTTGSGEHYQEFYGQEHPVRFEFEYGSLDSDEKNMLSLTPRSHSSDWVTFTSVSTGMSEGTETWKGSCLDMYEADFPEGTYELHGVDSEGRETISGRRDISYQTASGVVEFEYHRVG